MQKALTIKINFTGGIVSTGDLLEILNVAQAAQVTHVRFGLRQQLLMDVRPRFIHQLAASLREKNIPFEEKKEEFPNIVSSYAGAEIFMHDSWLSEGVYKDVFDLFDYRPRLKINICDNNQSFAPFFTSNINWIASSGMHFWHLFLRFPKTNLIFPWPVLVYTNDIPALSKKIEEVIFDNRVLFYENRSANGQKLVDLIATSLGYISKPIEEELVLPSFKLPYYEGFNRSGSKYWLGIYRRDELFPVDFLIDTCRICLQTKVGQLYTTPWKSIIVKGIEAQHRELWDYVLGKYRINVRHASNELNWQVEDFSREGLALKRYIIRQFDRDDVRSFGLCFAVKTQPKSGVFGSVIIRKQKNTNRNKLKSLDRYDILYTDGFNPNSKEYLIFRKDVEKEHLATYLISVCKYYYEQQSETRLLMPDVLREQADEALGVPAIQIVHQCQYCLSVYDEEAGDPSQGIEAGLSFESLPETYCCPLCEGSKKDFIQVDKSSLGLLHAV